MRCLDAGRTLASTRRACRAAAALILIGGAAPSLGSASSWVRLGPDGATITAIAAASEGVVYAGTDIAGVFRSTDEGRSWTAARSGLPRGNTIEQHVTALAVDPRRPRIVYAGTEFGPYVSRDGGLHWEAPRSGFPSDQNVLYVSALAIPADGSVVYASVNGNLFETPFGSAAWTPVSSQPDRYVITLANDPWHRGTIYAGANDGGPEGLYRSRNGGVTWRLLGTFSFGSLIAVDPSAPDTLYVASGTTLFRTTDAGRSWRPLQLPAASGASSLLVGADGTVYVGAGGILASADGGATWIPAAGQADPNDVVSALLAAPGEAALLYAGGEQGFWRSDDRGGHWRPASRGLDAPPLGRILVAPGVLYAAVGRSLLRRHRDGAWHEVYAAHDWFWLNGIDSRHPNVLFGSFGSPLVTALATSLDGGSTWTPLAFPEDIAPIQVVVDPKSSDVIYADFGQWSECGVLKSADGGRSWRCLTDLIVSALLVDPVHTSTLYLLQAAGDFTGPYLVYKSADGGATWAASARGLPRDRSVWCLALDPSNPSRLYAGSEGQHVLYRSSDGARTWTPVGKGLPGPVYTLLVDPETPAVLYAGVPGGVFRSADEGETWSDLSGDLPTESFGGSFLLLDPVPPERLYARVNSGIYMLELGDNRRARGVGAGPAERGEPAVSASRVFIGTVGTQNYLVDHRASALAVDRKTGLVVWRYPIAAPASPEVAEYGIAGSPVLGGGLVYFAGLDGRVSAFAQ